ncbi:MAG: PAS domain S-box protein [Candidatus Dormibacteria bacterium]
MSSSSTAGAARPTRQGRPGAARALRVLVCSAGGSPLQQALDHVERPAIECGLARPRAWRRDLGGGWDAIVVDESRPGWSAEEVLDEVGSQGAGIPVVVVCDPAREPDGVALVERGAADYLTADRLGRLTVAVRGAVEREELARTLARVETTSGGAQGMLDIAFHNSPEAMIAVDHAAAIDLWNPAAERLFGWSAAEARGRRLVDLVGGEDGGERLPRIIAEASAELGARQQIVPVRLRRRDGQAIHLDVWATQRRDSLPGAVLFLTDVTERWRADFLKDSQLAVLRALAAPGEEVALMEALEQIGLSVHGIAARLWETDARGTPQLRATWDQADADGVAGSLPDAPPAFVVRAISDGALTFSEVESTDAIGECLAIPVVNGQQIIGAVEIHAPRFPGYDDAYVAHLTGLGRFLGIHLAERRSQADFARSLEELNRINGERRRLMRLLVQAHEDERKTIAADIHDDPLQVMAAVSLRLHSLRRRLSDDAGQRSLQALEEMVGSAVSRLRSMMFNLRPTGLDRGDLLGPLRERLEQMREDDSIPFTLTGPEPELLTTDGRVALYRIAQEAIANVVKHASASRVDVAVGEQDGGCLLRISDDGAGLGRAVEGRSGHLGLPSIRERAELVGGWLQVEAGERAGTVVSAWVPLMSEPGQGGGRGL